ncbi:MAG: SprB repeat-containing protein, partial [Flavobacteriales bacterium]|nr:SprB repeat-containing protein [Flavobacteriales bacterium]
MRKLYLLLLATLLIVISSPISTNAQGNNCSTAASNLITLPYSGTGLTNCGSGNTYTSSNSVTCGSTSYLGGEDRLFAFTATITGTINITLTSSSSWVGLTIYQGCPTSGSCVGSSTGSSGNQSMTNITVTAGVTYYIMVDSYPSPSCHPSFNLSVSSITAAPPPPSNDNPCNATPLTVGSSCSYTTYTNANATATSGIPAPTCSNYLGGDVWFTATVPASGNLIIDSQTGVMTDGGMAVYTATSCSGTFTQVNCNDDSSPNGSMPLLNLTGLTPGQTLYIRFFEYGNNNNGTFGLCVYEPTPPPGCGTNPAAGNTCATATPICDLNGYCGNTSASYTANYWTQLGNGFSGSIENNSFISFVASSSSMSFDVYTSNCSYGYGIQLYLFSASNCSGAVTEFIDWNLGYESDATLSATGLTPGNTYYIMIDGNAGDVCDYQIVANSGVAIPVNAGPDVSICLGQSTSLTATGGNGTYSWSPTATLSSGSGATVNATPTTTTTYTVSSATGNPLCPSSTTDNVTVTVNNGGNVTLAGSSALSGSVGPTTSGSLSLNICNGGSATLNASGGSGTYTWSPSTGLSCTNCANPTASPSSTTTYTVTASNASGCNLVGTVTVNVSPAPTVSLTGGTICQGSSMTLTASGMSTYTWSPSTGLSATSGTSVTASPSSTTTYTVTGSTTGCPNDTETATVTVTPLPNPNFSISGSQCLSTNSITVTNTGTAGSYSWAFAGGTPASATGSPATTSFSTSGPHNITLTTTSSGCTNQITIPVTINPTPTVSVTPTPVNCFGTCTGSITASGSGTSGYTYNWGASGTGATLTNQCAGTYNVTMTDINGCTATGSGTISQPTVLAVTATATNVTCSGLNNGQVTANNATGGTPPYTYSWSGGLGTGQSLSNVAPGTYTVTVTDSKSCTATATVTVSSPSAIIVNATSTAANCGASDGTISVTSTTGGSGVYTSTVWRDGSNNVVANPNAVPSGSYTVTVTDNNGCTGTATVTISNLAGPVLSLVNQTNASCSMVNNGTATISVSGGSGSPSYSWSPAPGGGQGTTSVTGLIGGTAYTVTVSDAGCNDVLVVNIGVNADPTASTVVNQNVLCPGDCNGQATATMTGGTSPFTYSWSSGETGQQATSLCSGSAAVTITDLNGCTATSSAAITAPNPLTVSIIGTDATCNGGTNGTANVTITDGTAPYTISWSHGPTAEDLIGVLAAGTYTINVTDANGCSVSESVIIGQPNPITINPISAIDVSCNGGSNGSVTASITGGTGAISSTWTNSSSTPVGTGASASSLPIGTYTITATDANNCVQTANVTVGQPTPIVLTPSSTNSNCGQADGSVSVSASGGTVTSGYSFAWLDGSSNPIGNGATVNNQVAGTYSITVTDNNGCQATATSTISDLGGGSLSETHINSNCNGSFDGSINLSVSGGSAPFVYSWSGPNGFTNTNQDINLLEAGTYDVTVTDAVNCITTLSVIISQPTAVNVTASATDALCFGSSSGSLTATATGGTGAFSFVWYDDAILSNSVGSGSTLNGMAAGTYYVEATDVNNCSANSTIVLNQPAQISVTTTSTDANCGLSDGSVSVIGTAGGSNIYVSESWVDNGGNPVTNINALPSGSYTVTITDNNGCTGTAVQGIGDLVGPSLNIISVASVSCNGYCDGTALIEAVGGTPTYIYAWTPAPTSGQGTPSVAGLCAGNYNVSVSDDNGCTDNITVTVLEPAPLVATMIANSDVTINGATDGTATAAASGGTPAYTFAWYNSCPPASSIGQTNANATNLSAGTYSAIVTDSKGCLDTVCTTINQPTTINIVETIVNTQCFGSCDGEISITATGGVPGYTYEWYDITNTPIGQNGISASGLCAGDYYVVVEDQNGAIQTSNTFTVGQPTQLVVTTSVTSNFNGSDISCFNTCDGTANATVTGGSAPYSYLWGATAGSQTSSNATNLCDGTFSVSITDNHGCIVNSTVTLVQPTQVNNSPSQTDVTCNGLCDGVSTTTVTGGTGSYTYQWNDPSLSTTSSISSLCAGSYNVVITDANGCNINTTYSITEPNALVLTQSTQGSNCNQNDGSATVSIVSGDAPFSYLWDGNTGNQTTATASNLFAGCYDVDVTDGNGCIETLNICVQDLGAPTVTILTHTDVSCNGGNDGFAQIQVTDGTAPYTYSWEDCAGNSIGQTTASAFNLAAGCYNGSMVDNVGCTGSVSVTIVEPTALNALITNSSDVTCFGYCDGSATVTAGGGTGPYSYLWNDPTGQTTATATNLCPGTYQVEITDSQLCTFIATATIGEPLEIILSSSKIDAFCGTNTGSATVNIDAGGVAPFVYNWSPTSQNTVTASNLAPGVFDVTVTDNDGCIQVTQVTVGDIPPGISTIGTVVDVSCNGGNDGSIDVSMSGTGTAPYTYQWYNGLTNTLITGQTNQTATGLTAGDYYVIVTDVHGCVSTSNTGTIGQPDALQISSVITDALCYSSCDGIAEAVVSGGTQPYNYLWNDPLNQTSIAASGLCAGSIILTVTDENGCLGTHNLTIGQPTAISIDSTVTNANCNQPDGQACVTPSGGTGPYTYLWPDASTNSCAANLLAGTYIVSVFDQNLCEQQIAVEVQDLGGPVAAITNSVDVSCNGFLDGQATVDMISGNGTTYTVLWSSTAGNQTTPTASNLGAGLYSVTITDDLGCNASTSVTITEPDPITYNITETAASCFSYCDGEATITVIGGTLPYNITWLDNSNGNIGNASTVTDLCFGNYGVNVVDANSCAVTDNFTILQPVQVTGSITPTNISCFNACDGSATAVGIDGYAPFTFAWDINANNQTGSNAQNLCPGSYSVTITDNHGCQGTENVTITEPTELISSIDLSGNVSCFGFCDGFAQGNATGGTLPYTFSWSNNAGSNTLATNLCADAYVFTVTDGNGCVSTSNAIISQPTQLSASTSQVNLSCFQSCDGSATVSPSGGVSPYSFQWDNSTFSTSSSFANECAGTYSVLITDNNGCELSKTVNITQPTALAISANVTNSNCGQNNGQICANVNGGTAPYTYQWNDPNTQTGACGLSLNAGCYTFTVTDANACVTDTLLCINDIAGPTVNTVGSNDVTCFGAGNGSVEFTATGGTGALTNNIVDNLGLTVVTGAVSAAGLDGGCYTLISTDAAGCIASDVLCVNEPSQLNAAVIQHTDATCFQHCDGTALAAANGGSIPYTYSWNSGATPTQNSNSGLCSGTFTVTVTDNNNCSTTATTTISEPTQLMITEVISDVTCFAGSNGSVDVTVTGGTPFYVYSWAPSGSSLPDQSMLNAGNYTLTVVDANSCDATANYTISEPTQLVPSFVNFNSPTCEQCNGTATVSTTGGTGSYSYMWSSGNNLTSTANSGMCPGNQTVTVTDANGCSMSISQTMVNQASPQIDGITFTSPSCNGLTNGSATVFASGIFSSSQFTYLWDAATNAQQTQTAVALGDGVYCVTVTDPNGCVASSCTNITEPTPLNAVPDGSTTICYGQDAQIWASGQGGTSPYNIQWSPAGFSGTGPILVSPTTSTDYCFRVEDNNGCLSSIVCVEITVREPLALNVTPSTYICSGGDIDLTAIGTGGVLADYNFNWETQAGTPVTDVTVNDQSTVTVGPSIATWYYVTLSDGCSIDAIDSTEISVSPLPIGFLAAADS